MTTEKTVTFSLTTTVTVPAHYERAARLLARMSDTLEGRKETSDQFRQTIQLLNIQAASKGDSFSGALDELEKQIEELERKTKEHDAAEKEAADVSA